MIEDERQQPENEIQFWRRGNITQAQLMRVRSIALNLANIVYAQVKDTNIRADIAELRRIFNGDNGQG